MIEFLLPVLGFLIGTVASMVGVGGGVFIVPLLALFYGFSPSHAVGTSLATIVFTSLAATLNYSRQNRIYYKTGLLLALTTVPGSLVGAYLTSIIEERLLGLIFAIFLFFVAFRMIFKLNFSRRQRLAGEKNEETIDSEDSLLRAKNKFSQGVALAFFAGISSGLLGIGGGSVMVPIMALALKMSMHITVATSMFTMVFTSTSGLVEHFRLNNVDLTYALLLVLGTIFGAQLGAYTSKRISGIGLRRIFGVVLILVSLRMIMKYGPASF